VIFAKFCVFLAKHSRQYFLRCGVRRKAFAKINLGLRVLERRPDGYHNIETVFHRVNLFDELTFEPSDRIEVDSNDPAAPGDETNLCYRAARLVQDLLHSSQGVHISLEKQIPVGAGLGGGSSDAAVVLRELPRVWKASLDRNHILGLALRLGSDIPYFLGDGSALGFGRGEVLEYFSLDIPYSILICCPKLHISTAWAYGRVQPRSAEGRRDLKAIVLQGAEHPEILREELVNDFEPAVFSAYPEIALIKKDMFDQGAVFASLSGSGSTVYGLFTDPSAASSAADGYRARGYRAFLTLPHFRPGMVS
jgi:4-diphosphocytidyl-2-C-methyl-D-erythritol kinase